MKEQFTTNAINLKSYNLGESDKIVVMYSIDRGIIRGIAKGVKKPKSKLGAGMDLFVANRLMLNRGKSLDTVCRAEALNPFLNIRKDMDKILYSMYCSEIVSNFGTENDPNSEEIYNLFYSFLEKIAKSETKIDSMLAVLKFQLKIADITGYSIEFNECVKCGKKPKDNIYFSVEQGGILCTECARDYAKKTKIPFKLTEFLKTISTAGFDEKTLYDSLVTEKICDICIKLMKDYIVYYSPKKFKTLSVTEGIL